MNHVLSDVNSGDCVQWVQVLVFAILVFLPVTGLPSQKPYVCDGKYKDGGKPDQASLKMILSDHAAWLESGLKENDTRRANLCNADVSGADLMEANLREANLVGAKLVETLLGGADLSGTDLNGADLFRADLNGAILIEANLRGANLGGADLSAAKLGKADLSGVDLTWHANLRYAILREATLYKANLEGSILIKADLFKANLSGANLAGANLDGADMSGADLSGANLFRARLNNVKLINANLSKADLRQAELIQTKLINTILSNAKFTNINLERVTYEPSSTPDKAFLGGIRNLDTVRFDDEKQSGLVLLRNSLKESGLRELERKATYAIEKGKTDHASSLLEKITRRLFFEHTAGYGLYPGQCLIMLLSLIPAFSLIYFFSVYRKKDPPGQRQSGVYRIWLDERIRKDLGSAEPQLINAGFVKSIGYAFYFSLLSAFHIGYRDINVGNWIARIQPREYTLRSTGWVRTVSGIQSLISIYLLAFWVLTQFGRPFD